MRLSAAAKKKIQRIERAFDSKPEELEHIYLDDTLKVRDRHIEQMFQDCFDGHEFDLAFQTNFGIYFEHLAQRLLPRSMSPGPEIFSDVGLAQAWVTYNFGLFHCKRIEPYDPILNNPEFSHCTHEALVRAYGLCPTAVHCCYAPSALHATFLTVVNIYRELAHTYHEEVLSRSK